VYSFRDRNMAEAALQALKNSGYQAFLVMSDLGKKGDWYRVRVGGIGDEAAAHKMLGEIRKNYNSGFILKPKN
jgi:cell division septation protein DedD